MSSGDDKHSTYQSAGVDLEAAAETVDRYRDLVDDTRVPGVLGEVGGFGGLFALRDAGVELDDPVLVSGTDGVGTKLKLAFELGRHDTIGIDCVAMCVNDVVATGARPLFFLDYLATGRLDPDQAADVVRGIAAGCRESGCALIGGETAEMPGFYADGEYDVAGFCVGVAERSALLRPSDVEPTDVLVGIASSGFHSNGYSLVRKIVDDESLDLGAPFDPTGKTLGAALLEPTKLYAKAVQSVLETTVNLRAAAHVTGGGFYENLPRVIPDGMGIAIEPGWSVPNVITHVCDAGRVAPRERYRVFNMGIGMVLIVPQNDVDETVNTLAAVGYEALAIGEVTTEPGVRIHGIDD